MPHTFLQVGTHWINLDLVTSVELVVRPTTADPNAVGVARITFAGGRHMDFTSPANIQTIAAWLHDHKAP